MREVLDLAHLRDALRVTPADATVAAALRCGGAVALALVACAVAGHPELAGVAGLGALTSLYGRDDPYRRRAALLALVGTVLVAGVAVTTLAVALGVPVVLTLAVVALLAGGMTALCQLLRTGPPGATIVVFATGAGMAGSPTLADLGPRVGAGALGAFAAWLVCCSGWLWSPGGPARLAVRRAVDATDRALRPAGPDEQGDGDARTSPHDDAAARARLAAARAATARAATARARTVLADDASHRRTRPLALRLAVDLDELDRRLAAPDSILGPDLGPAVRTTPAPLPRRRTLREHLRAGSPGWRPAAFRVAAGSALAAAMAQVAGFGHPAWASMGATATLQGSTTSHAVVRAVQRAGGTAAGALVAWPLLSMRLGFWAVCASVVALQVVTEVVVGRNYGVAMLTITPMALLMTSLGGSGESGALALDRALDTLLGAVVAVTTLVLLPHVRPGQPAAIRPATTPSATTRARPAPSTTPAAHTRTQPATPSGVPVANPAAAAR